MANLKNEYTDTRDKTHKVEHIIVPSEDKASGDRIVEELFQALARAGKRISA